MKSRFLVSVLIAIVGIIVTGSALLYLQKTKIVPQKNDQWKTYQNEKWGFVFDYPSDTIFDDTHLPQYYVLNASLGSDYVLYATPGSEQPPDYYMNILVFDHGLGQKTWYPCSESVIDSKDVSLGKYLAHRGSGRDIDFEETFCGTPKVLCIEADDADFYIQGADCGGTFIERIFDSFTFPGVN